MRYIVGTQIVITDRNAPKGILKNLQRNKPYKITDIKPVLEDGEVKRVNYKFLEIVRPDQTPSMAVESFLNCSEADKIFDMLLGVRHRNTNNNLNIENSEEGASLQERLKNRKPDKNVIKSLNRRR